MKAVVRTALAARSGLGESTSEANLLAAGVRARNRIGPVCRCTITSVKPCSPRDSRFASRTDRLGRAIQALLDLVQRDNADLGELHARNSCQSIGADRRRLALLLGQTSRLAVCDVC